MQGPETPTSCCCKCDIDQRPKLFDSEKKKHDKAGCAATAAYSEDTTPLIFPYLRSTQLVAFGRHPPPLGRRRGLFSTHPRPADQWPTAPSVRPSDAKTRANGPPMLLRTAMDHALRLAKVAASIGPAESLAGVTNGTWRGCQKRFDTTTRTLIRHPGSDRCNGQRRQRLLPLLLAHREARTVHRWITPPLVMASGARHPPGEFPQPDGPTNLRRDTCARGSLARKRVSRQAFTWPIRPSWSHWQGPSVGQLRWELDGDVRITTAGKRKSFGRRK